MMKRWNKWLSKEKKEHMGGVCTIFFACLSTWTLARTSSKRLYLSAHPNKKAGQRRVMKVGWTCAASVQHAPHSWGGSAVAALIGWWFTPPPSGVSKAVCAASSPNDWSMLSMRSGMTFGKCLQEVILQTKVIVSTELHMASLSDE